LDSLKLALICSGALDEAHQTGVFACAPMMNEAHQYHCAVELGSTALSAQQVAKMLPGIQQQWLGTDYSMVSKNCCHFCEEFARRLGVATPPAWLNKLARMGERLGL